MFFVLIFSYVVGCTGWQYEYYECVRRCADAFTNVVYYMLGVLLLLMCESERERWMQFNGCLALHFGFYLVFCMKIFGILVKSRLGSIAVAHLIHRLP